MYQTFFTSLPLLIIIAVNCHSTSAADVVPSILEQKSVQEEWPQKKSTDNYKFKTDGGIKAVNKPSPSPSPSPSSPSSSSAILSSEKDAYIDPARRQHRCLVEATFYRRALTADGYMRKKNRSVAPHTDEPQPEHHIHSRAKRSQRTARPYFTVPTDNVAIVEIPSPHIDGKIIFSTGPFRHVWITDGLKIWGAGSESKFPPLFEYFVQRIQSYYSIYKYEDLSRPGIEWATTIRPDPKPLPDTITLNELEGDGVTVADMTVN